MAGVAVLADLPLSNFVGGETKIEHRIERPYPIDVPRFRNEPGVLRGPPFVQEAQVPAPLNGDEILPLVLATIGAARV